MMQPQFETARARASRPAEAELSEELRMLALLRVRELSGADPAVEVRGTALAGDLEIPLETAFAIVEYLSRKGYLDYHGAGPRVSITPLGVESLQAVEPRGRGRDA